MQVAPEMKRFTAILLGSCVIAASLLLGAGCSRLAPVSLPAPAEAVDSLLRLRWDESTDASAYATYLKSADLARQLADDASATAEVTSTPHPPIPKWKAPYVSASGDSSASVVVVWEPTARIKKWPKATVFKLELMGRAWKVVDAIETTSAPKP